MRIVAGKYRSRTLRSLHGAALRPTSDRLRETLFSILGRTVEGSMFVDVYAGTGAVGIEALSRGARKAVFIENHAAAVQQIRRNLQSLDIDAVIVSPGSASHTRRFGEGPLAEILAGDAVRGLERLAARLLHAQFVFLDPPYAETKEYSRVLDFLDSSSLLTPAGLVIVEHARRHALPEYLAQLERVRLVEQGDAALSFYRLSLAA